MVRSGAWTWMSMAGYRALVIAVRGRRASVSGIGGTMCPSGFQPGGAATSSGRGSGGTAGGAAGGTAPRSWAVEATTHPATMTATTMAWRFMPPIVNSAGCESTSPQPPTR